MDDLDGSGIFTAWISYVLQKRKIRSFNILYKYQDKRPPDVYCGMLRHNKNPRIPARVIIFIMLFLQHQILSKKYIHTSF